MKIHLSGGYYIETWYDRHTRSWVSQLKDREGSQLGDAEYSGTKAGVPVSQELLKNRVRTLEGIE